MSNEYVGEETLKEDVFGKCKQFEDTSAFSSVQWKEDNKDIGGFGDWTSFNRSLSEEIESVQLWHQESPIHEHKVEHDTEVSPWFVFQDCFHIEEMEKDTDTKEILTLSQILHSSTQTPCQPTGVSREGANLYHSLLHDPKSGPKPLLHSHKKLTYTLQLKEPDTHTLQNTDCPDLGFELPENSPAGLIQTKLTVPIWCQNKPGFLYQISRQWFNQYSNGLQQNHQD